MRPEDFKKRAREMKGREERTGGEEEKGSGEGREEEEEEERRGEKTISLPERGTMKAGMIRK